MPVTLETRQEPARQKAMTLNGREGQAILHRAHQWTVPPASQRGGLAGSGSAFGGAAAKLSGRCCEGARASCAAVWMTSLFNSEHSSASQRGDGHSGSNSFLG